MEFLFFFQLKIDINTHNVSFTPCILNRFLTQVTCTEELLESLKLATQKNDILRLTIVDNIREANFDRHWRKSNDGFSAFIAITLAVLIFGSSVMAFKRLISGTGKESAYDYACPHSKLIGTYTAPDTLSKPLLINHTDQHGQSYVSDKLWILDWKGEGKYIS